MAKTWKKISQKILLTHPRLTVYEDEVVLPNGHKTQYIHFGKGADAAAIIAIDKQGKILVQKEYSYPPNEWLYQFPCGGMLESETPEQGALRELAEEAGLSGTLKQIGWYYLDNRRSQNKMYVFVATELFEHHLPQDIEEEFETFWFSEEEIDKLIKNGEIVNFSILACWPLYKQSR